MQERVLETERFIKSMRLLQLNDRSGEISVTPVEGNQFEDYTFHLYRQMAPNFEERCKYLEKKLFYSVSPKLGYPVFILLVWFYPNGS